MLTNNALAAVLATLNDKPKASRLPSKEFGIKALRHFMSGTYKGDDLDKVVAEILGAATEVSAVDAALHHLFNGLDRKGYQPFKAHKAAA